MKSPVPTSFVFLLAALFAIAVFFGGVVLLIQVGSRFPVGRYAGLLSLLLLGGMVQNLLGMLAALRYRGDRRTLNIIGLSGNALLLLGFIGTFGFAFWTAQQTLADRRPGGPIEVVD
jgi:nitrate reductase NapE component